MPGIATMSLTATAMRRLYGPYSEEGHASPPAHNEMDGPYKRGARS